MSETKPPSVQSETGRTLSPDRAALEAALPVLEKAAEHYDCEDCWYSCATLTCDDGRKSDVCDCRAAAAIPALALVRAALAADLCDWCNVGEHSECALTVSRGVEPCGCRSSRHPVIAPARTPSESIPFPQASVDPEQDQP